MRVLHPHGSQERLFEMMKKVNNLNETPLPMEDKMSVVNKFIDFAAEKLEMGEDVPNVKLSFEEKEAAEMKSFGKFTPEINELLVVATNRNLADILRTLAHELIHYKQNKDGRLDINSSETGSDIENEANALAGVLLREFGQKNPIIFE